VIAGNQKKEDKPWTELVPKEYHQFEDIFTKKDLMCYPHTAHGTITLNWTTNMNPILMANSTPWIPIEEKN
jgi:hypothetical protein